MRVWESILHESDRNSVIPLNSWISIVTVQFKLVVLHVRGKDLPDYQHSGSGRAGFLSVSQALRSARIWTWQRKYEPSQNEILPGLSQHNLSHLKSSTDFFQRFFSVGIMARNSWDPICWDVVFEFHCSLDVVHRIWRAAPAKQKISTSGIKKSKSRDHKYTSKTYANQLM